MTTTDQTDRAGIHAVGLTFTKLNWAFREQPTSDFGIDAQAEKLNPDGKAGGKLIALQIKTGKSYFRERGDNYVYYGDERHLDYWTNHSLPVFLILHDPETGLTLWQRIERHRVEEGKDGRWSIEIPRSQVLDTTNEPFLAAGIASDLPSLRRARLTLDLPLIQQLADQPEIYFRVEDWVNKTLNYRGAEILFSDDEDAEVQLSVHAWMPGYTIEYYMAVFFPWLDWEVHEYHSEEEGSFEVAWYVLKAEVSDVGKALLKLEEFYQTELPPFHPDPGEIPVLDTWQDQ